MFLEWFGAQSKFTKPWQEMEKGELCECLQVFCAAARKQDGSEFKVTSLRSIRSAIDRHLKQAPYNKPWSLIADPAFEKANKVLNAICKKHTRKGKIGTLEKLFESGQLGNSDSKNPRQLMQTAWFYVMLYFGKRGRENISKLSKKMLVLRSTPQGRRYFELRREALVSTKNHRGGVDDNYIDEADGKMFEVSDSPRCPVKTLESPVKTLESLLKLLHPNLDTVFQRPREICAKFNVQNDEVWYYNSPIGVNTFGNLLKTMSKAAGIIPYLTNDSIRASSVTVLSDSNVEARHIKAVTGHKSDNSIESYNTRASFQQKENMSNILSRFVAGSQQNQCSSTNTISDNPASYTVQKADENTSDVQLRVDNKATNFDMRGPHSFNFHNCSVSIVNNSIIH